MDALLTASTAPMKLETGNPLLKRPADSFRFGFAGEFGGFAGESLYFGILDVQRNGVNPS